MSTTTQHPDQTLRPARAGRLRRALGHPVGWLVAGAAGVSVVAGATAADPALAIVGGAVAIGVYAAVMRLLARQATPELSRRGAIRSASVGALIGAAFIAVSMGAVVSEFDIRWADHDVWSVLLRTIGIGVGAAVTEELLFRGLALQAFEPAGPTDAPGSIRARS